MTEDEVTRLRALCDGATQEPWEMHGTVVVYSPVCCRKVAEADEADAAFIATARTALPAALDEITRLRALVEAAFAEGQRTADRYGDTLYGWSESDAYNALNP